MTSQLSKNNTYNLEYTIPRIELGLPGRQDRSGTSRMRISPGMAEPMEFNWGNVDGVPLNVAGMSAKLVFWKSRTFDGTAYSSGDDMSEIVLTKILDVPDPHSGSGYTMLVGADTMKLWQASRITPIRWGMFLINGSGDVFPLQITPGQRSGTAEFDQQDQMPLGEMVRSS